MSDSTPTQKITTVVDSDAPKSRTLLYVLIGIGALLLIAVIVLIVTLLSRATQPDAEPSPTPTESSASPSPTPTETSATPTPTVTVAPPPPAPAPAPVPVPGFDSFAYEQDAGCQPGDSQQQLTFSWSSDDAVRAYVGVQTNNAKTGSYSGELPAVYTYSDIYYNCDQASQYYTVTLEDAAGHLTHKTVTIKP